MNRILLVDDEAQIINSLQRAFFDTDYEIFTADNAAAALELLETQDIELIISDIRMPMMDGYEFLKQVKKKYPKILRVIMSAYFDEQVIIEALTDNVAKHYILKPWETSALLNCIDKLLETQRKLDAIKLLTLFNNIGDFPTIQTSYRRIHGLIDNDASMITIANEIEKDFAISTKLLQVVNSAFFGVKTGSIHHATKILGLQNITNLVLTTSIINAVRVFHLSKDLYELFWNHALITSGILSFIYSKFLAKKLPDAALSAGLLHNIGIFAEAKLLKDQAGAIYSKATPQLLNLLDIERDLMTVTHQDIGGYLLNWWDLPFPIIEAALFHHTPFDSAVVNTELVQSVHIAQYLAWSVLKKQPLTPFFPETYDALGIDQEQLMRCIAEENWLQNKRPI